MRNIKEKLSLWLALPCIKSSAVMLEGIMMGEDSIPFTRGKSFFHWTRLSIAIPFWIPPKCGQLQHHFTVLFLSMNAVVAQDVQTWLFMAYLCAVVT